MSTLLNTVRIVKVPIERIALTGDVMWPANVDRDLRRRGTQRIGSPGYGFLRTLTSPEGEIPRVELTNARIEHLESLPRGSATQQNLYTRRLRLAAWDAWAQAAMSAEDLEIFLTGLSRWRERADFFRSLPGVDAEGPGYFGDAHEDWQVRLAGLVRLPSPIDLHGCLTVPEATLLTAGLVDSVRQATDDLRALESLIPWDIRRSMFRYKHGFVWLIPSVAPLRTDDIGRRRLDAAAATAFVVWTGNECGFRSNPITRFAPIRSPITEQSDQPFRSFRKALTEPLAATA